MAAAPSGVRVGHWTAAEGTTGCTVIVFPEGTVASGEVRGGAPATREFAMLEPSAMVQHVDAVVLSGGSAFGLATVDGVMSGLAEAGRGFETSAGRVPIVVGLALFDLAEGQVRPGPAAGRAALDRALDSWSAITYGGVGAGAGATVGKWRPDRRRPGGLGYAEMSRQAATSEGESVEVRVAALVAVNAVGDLDDGSIQFESEAGRLDAAAPFENTTIGVVWTNAGLDKIECRLVAESGHDGLARALIPAHTRYDGDALVAASLGSVQAPLMAVRTLATTAVEQAIHNAIPQ